MKKKIPFTHPGFTIAEILISMLIVMVVAMAMVPIVGPKKIKDMNYRNNHGIAECYWENNEDGSAVLRYYYADNRNNMGGQMREPAGNNYCTFEVPKANRYDIYAIGAGSNGVGQDGEGIGYNFNPEERFQGSIGLQNFSNDMTITITNTVGAKLSDELVPNRHFYQVVQETMTRWAYKINNNNNEVTFANDIFDANQYQINPDAPYLYAELNNIASPVGTKGADYIPAECYLANMQCPEQQRNGGKAGLGRKIRSGASLLFPIDGRLDVGTNFTALLDNTGINIASSANGGMNTNSFALTAATSGHNATASSNGSNGTKSFAYAAIDNNIPAKFLLNNNLTNINTNADPDQFPLNSTSNNNATEGRLNYMTANAFSWTFTEPRVLINYGGAGKPGEIAHRPFTKLSGTLYLYPGQNINGNAINSIAYTDENQTSKIIEAPSSTEVGTAQSTSYRLSEVDNPALPNEAVLKNCSPSNTKLDAFISQISSSNAYGKGGLYNCDKTGTCPGYAGSGAYPLITDYKDYKNILRLTNNQSYASRIAGSTSYSREFEPTELEEENIDCPDGMENPNKDNPNHLQYCVAPNTGRRDGAIIIIW